LDSHSGAILFGDSGPGPVDMRGYGLGMGDICERNMTLLEGKTNG